MDAQLTAAVIRRAVLGDTDAEPTRIGDITLHPHQGDAVHRLRAAIRRFGGALLADDPGMGKTFVALAIARDFMRTVVFAPAAVRDAWSQSAASAGVSITVVSLDRMSRASPPAIDADFVIIDEAQHVGAPGTARRRALATCCAGRPVLLLSATPVRNRLSELHALLALFLGQGASVDAAMLAQCVVRREASSTLLPAVVTAPPLRPPRTPALDREIRALPPAVPLQNGGTAASLVTIGLLRCRGSSIAALCVALRRRLQRGAALDAALAQGHWPSATELRRWLVADDTVQLQLALDPPTADATRWHRALHHHCEAVRRLLLQAQTFEHGDSAGRAAMLRSVLDAHPDVPVVAFSQHTATVRALYRELRDLPHVALLTADGARSASGGRSRADLIAALAPGGATRRPSHDRLRLLLATDLLSEGVNLQSAGVVVHLDLPWTPARVRQRTGRVARMGAEHAAVFEYVVSQSREIARTLAMHRRHHQKQRAGERATAASTSRERLRELIERWPSIADAPRRTASQSVIASVQGEAAGFLAVVESSDERFLVGGTRRARLVAPTIDPARLVRVAEGVTVPLVPTPGGVTARDANDVQRALFRFLEHRGARHVLDADGPRTALRRRLMRRAMDVLTRTPVVSKRAAAVAIARLRLTLGQAPAAGVEPLLKRALSEPVADKADALEWLERTSSALATLASVAALASVANPRACGVERCSPDRVTALLLITPAEQIPRRARPTPSSRS